jgi:hypothetical protein
LRIGIKRFKRQIDIKTFWLESRIFDEYIEIFDENEFFPVDFSQTIAIDSSE